MIEFSSVSHHIQKHIIDVLMYQKYARFRDLRPKNTDTNLFSYHLSSLLKTKMVEKSPEGYTLSLQGLSYVDRVSSEVRAVRTQPKIITMLVIQNSNGDVLLQHRSKQPYIGTWTLPYGKLHIEDETTAAAAKREAWEKLGVADAPVVHAGDCYVRVHMDGAILSTTLAHIYRFNTDEIKESDTIHWARPLKLGHYELAPAVEEIITQTFFQDPYFFEEFTTDWKLGTAVVEPRHQ